MKIIVNGEPRECQNACSILDLLDELNIPADQAAIVVNDDVVSPKRRAYIVLREGDRVEILTLAAGG
ncbi:MAG: sulfur carrier protein ThiS [Verrucomicrobia bacterium]|nr:sulfur carrier protein ThiS [Verrucomicrobiota bacterium]MCG2680994.1 sulfur carrier protein ThiS [Kiritimatiellia bacterium]MBU4247774.1 sulfur carrier protein ThiS [Verrucomicrobiota bacterium]MBU4292062.1 sulfur carrier protein ThiS [Verrucomicrobiota bacterium]MBU4429983.1 sulfur carrier protein ThiS [Verrucomicrobiota bacterium]